jgi:hypothetical protein
VRGVHAIVAQSNFTADMGTVAEFEIKEDRNICSPVTTELLAEALALGFEYPLRALRDHPLVMP